MQAGPPPPPQSALQATLCFTKKMDVEKQRKWMLKGLQAQLCSVPWQITVQLPGGLGVP